MKKAALLLSALAFLAGYLTGCSPSTQPPDRPDLRELGYNAAIEGRTTNILKVLEIADPAKSNKLHDIIMAQYRAYRARDEVIDADLKKAGKLVTDENRSSRLLADSKPLHEKFLSDLSALLTPEQIEKVKDKMTYNKVQVTFDAYCAIVPGLTDEDKAKIMEQLKLAREEAMDGGSASEKSRIFRIYKDHINDYLNAHGHDVAQAYKDWDAKQEAAKKAAGGAITNAADQSK